MISFVSEFAAWCLPLSLLVATLFTIHIFKSSKISPNVYVGEDSILFTIPDECAKRKVLGFEFKRSVTYIEVELNEIDDQTKTSKKKFTLKVDSPFKKLDLKPQLGYSYRFETKQTLSLIPSSLSEYEKVVVKRPPFSIIQNPTDQAISGLLESIKAAKPCNILLVGKPGAGKSSFLNTLFTVVNRTWTIPAVACHLDGSVTPAKTDYKLIEDKITICDMFGLEKGHNQKVIQGVIKGRYQTLTLDNMKNENYELAPEGTYPKINVAILVIGADYRNDDMAMNRQLMEHITEAGISCLTVVTKVDKLRKPAEKEVDISAFHKDPRVVQCCNEIAGTTSVDVVPIVNYTNYRENQNSIDYVALHILDIALRLARY